MEEELVRVHDVKVVVCKVCEICSVSDSEGQVADAWLGCRECSLGLGDDACRVVDADGVPVGSKGRKIDCNDTGPAADVKDVGSGADIWEEVGAGEDGGTLVVEPCDRRVGTG